MRATIWHNPACGTSRSTVAILQETAGIELTVIEYLKDPPTRDKLVQLHRDAGLTHRQAMRTTNSPAAELVADLGLKDADEATILDAMMAHPALIQRSLVETDKGDRLCRPPETVHEIM
ncbi:MAG: arsenate reductase (glutaredoxin) [Sphingomonas sp. 12-62-6]|nr:MAG: arsenate reductase (glutaredoxin) [Sphingomonas sp. 12-62-6]